MVEVALRSTQQAQDFRRCHALPSLVSQFTSKAGEFSLRTSLGRCLLRCYASVSPRPTACGGSPIERGFGRSVVATKPDLKGNYCSSRPTSPVWLRKEVRPFRRLGAVTQPEISAASASQSSLWARRSCGNLPCHASWRPETVFLASWRGAQGDGPAITQPKVLRGQFVIVFSPLRRYLQECACRRPCTRKGGGGCFPSWRGSRIVPFSEP